MKQHLSLLFLMFLIAGCGGNYNPNADTRSLKERMEDEREGSVLGKDALSWQWGAEAEKKAAAKDPVWEASSRVLSNHPISFSNYHARIIQTDWIELNDLNRYRVTLRTLGVEVKEDSLNISVLQQNKTDSGWKSLPIADVNLVRRLKDKILMEATRIYDAAKRD